MIWTVNTNCATLFKMRCSLHSATFNNLLQPGKQAGGLFNTRTSVGAHFHMSWTNQLEDRIEGVMDNYTSLSRTTNFSCTI